MSDPDRAARTRKFRDLPMKSGGTAGEFMDSGAARTPHRDDCIQKPEHRYFDGTLCLGCVQEAGAARTRAPEQEKNDATDSSSTTTNGTAVVYGDTAQTSGFRSVEVAPRAPDAPDLDAIKAKLEHNRFDQFLNDGIILKWSDAEVEGLLAEAERLRAELAQETKAAGHWFREANRDHNDLVKLRAAIAAGHAPQPIPPVDYQARLYPGETGRAHPPAEIYEHALRSIAANSCCNRCQEAALVARAALHLASAPQGADPTLKERP